LPTLPTVDAPDEISPVFTTTIKLAPVAGAKLRVKVTVFPVAV
jgi:hypothetical protein